MNSNEYNKELQIIEKEYEYKLHKLRLCYVTSNAEFKVGNFIGNVTGIIKVDRIDYDIIRDIPDIIYIGYRYKKHKGEILRTKDKKISYLRNYNLKLIQ